MLHTTPEVQSLIERALQEDLGLGDPTTDALIPPDREARAVIFAKAPGVLCGLEVALAVFRRIDPAIQAQACLQDGARLKKGDVIARLQGRAASLLKGERVALNFLQHLSGIATETARYVEAVQGLPVRILDTRKTLPGWRPLAKYAVRTGGGQNHRMALGDGILVKDNHIALLRAQGISLGEIVRRALERAPHTLKVEVEVTAVADAREALEAGAHLLLLDNMPLEGMREVARLAKGRALLEASGGITLETVRSVAETGVDFISVGALTHSARALDISVEIEAEEGGLGR